MPKCLNSIKAARRKRYDVCTPCGWNMIIIERGYECANPHCTAYGQPTRKPRRHKLHHRLAAHAARATTSV